MLNLRLLAPLAVLIALSGCGGGGSGHRSSSDPPLAGTYSGMYAATSSEDDKGGTLAFTVGADGTVSGTVEDSVSGSGTLASSTLTKKGEVVLTFAFSGIAETYRGTLSREGSTYSGTLDRQNGDIAVSFDFSLTRTGD